MWYKQVTARCAMICGSLLREKVLCVAKGLGIKDFRACNGWISVFKQWHTVVYKTISCVCGTVGFSLLEVCRREQLMKIIEGYEHDIIMLMRLGCSNKKLSFKGDHALVERIPRTG